MDDAGVNIRGAASHSDASIIRRFLDRTLVLITIAVMVFGAFYPEYAVPGWHIYKVLAMIAIVLSVGGGLIAPRGSTLAFMLLWAACGMATAIGTIGFFSIGIASI